MSSGNQKPKICLNMIVKNEEHVIEETLECMTKYIDYYVISDTGSTDNTIEVIKNFFNKKGIPGEVHQNEWKNFGHNRTVALNLCVGKSDYIWVIDADDIVIGDLKLPEVLDKDCYTLTYGEGFTYHRQQIFKNSPELNWKYVGVLHEFPTCDDSNHSKGHINGDYFVDSRRLGDRNKDPEKYLKDAKLLEAGLEEEPDNERYMFYLAQSYYDYGNIEKGIEWYKKRIALGRWFEEVFYSYYRIATGLEALGKPWEEVEKAYMDAYIFCKDRAEPLYKIALHYRTNNNFKKAYKYAKMASRISFPEHCVLFIYRDVYDFKIWDELAISAYYVGEYMESYLICKKLLSSSTTPVVHHPRILENLKFAESKLGLTDKPNCVIYTGHYSVHHDQKFKEILDDYSKYYNIYLLGNNIDISSLTYKNVYVVDKHLLEKMKVNQKFTCVILYNCLDLLLESTPFKNSKLILFLTKNWLRFHLRNNLTVRLTNQNYVNSLLRKIDLIVVSEKSVESHLNSVYGLDQNIVCVENVSDLHTIFDETKHHYRVKIDNPYTKSNGYKLILPEWKLTPENAHYVQNSKLSMIEEACRILPRPELDYYRQKQLTSMGLFVNAMEIVNKAIKSCKKTNLGNYEDFLLLEKAKLLHLTKKYNESYKLANTVLNRSRIAEKDRPYGEDIRDVNVKHIKDSYLAYPKNKINSIKPGPRTKIVLSITTCKRYDLFEKTVNSFINCCVDLERIDCWLCVDDNSSEKDRMKMKKKYPFFTFIWKDENEKGHWVSMNKIRDFVLSNNAEYLLHMEDDFHFVQRRNYITDALTILKCNKNYGQLLFNKNYSEVETSQIRIPGGLPRKLPNLRFLVHEHYDTGTKEYNEFVNKHVGHGTNAYWPHFSFRPSILRCSVLKDIGCFSHTPHFELQYAKEYKSSGYISTFFDTFSCIHIGKKTWEKDGVNSYNLNSTNQFTIDSDKLSVHVIKGKNQSIWKMFKQDGNTNLPYYQVTECGKVDTIPDEYKEVFLNNRFNYCRRVLSEYLAHFKIWKSASSRYILVLYDTVKCNNKFSSNLENILQNVDSTVDIHFLSKNQTELAYIIKKESVNKILEGLKNVELDVDFTNLFGCTDSIKTTAHDLAQGIVLKREQPDYEHLEGYKFYSQMDSYGGDLEFNPDKSVTELKLSSNSDPECIGFNTTGWMKKVICSETDMVHLYNSTKESEGLYIKI